MRRLTSLFNLNVKREAYFSQPLEGNIAGKRLYKYIMKAVWYFCNMLTTKSAPLYTDVPVI